MLYYYEFLQTFSWWSSDAFSWSDHKHSVFLTHHVSPYIVLFLIFFLSIYFSHVIYLPLFVVVHHRFYINFIPFSPRFRLVRISYTFICIFVAHYYNRSNGSTLMKERSNLQLEFKGLSLPALLNVVIYYIPLNHLIYLFGYSFVDWLIDCFLSWKIRRVFFHSRLYSAFFLRIFTE